MIHNFPNPPKIRSPVESIGVSSRIKWCVFTIQPTTVVLSLVCAIPAVKFPSYLGYLFSNDVLRTLCAKWIPVKPVITVWKVKTTTGSVFSCPTKQTFNKFKHLLSADNKKYKHLPYDRSLWLDLRDVTWYSAWTARHHWVQRNRMLRDIDVDHPQCYKCVSFLLRVVREGWV